MDKLSLAPIRRDVAIRDRHVDGTFDVDPQPAETLSEIHHRQTSDPRPELSDDSALWSRALTLEWHRDHGHVSLWGILRVLRSCGVRMRWQEKDGTRFLALDRGEMGEAEYERDRRQLLLPYKERLVMLLRHLAEEEKEYAGMEVVNA